MNFEIVILVLFDNLLQIELLFGQKHLFFLECLFLLEGFGLNNLELPLKVVVISFKRLVLGFERSRIFFCTHLGDHVLKILPIFSNFLL